MTREQLASNKLYWVRDNVIANEFPDVDSALTEPDGLLAIGGDLLPSRLLSAYRRGIFPWFSEGQPILWWSPNPRWIFQPGQIKISRSLNKILKKQVFRITFDQSFEKVVAACAAPRKDNAGTWITTEMKQSYQLLHAEGYAHSVECWHKDRLVGGLYGVAIGEMFFGESMFSRMSNASKVALAHLSAQLRHWNFNLIDCQMYSKHLESLGAIPIPRKIFTAKVIQYTKHEQHFKWPVESKLA